VLAASSLSNAFADLERAFLAEHDCVAEVDVIFGASSSLAAQVVNGAPVDVFVSASRESMRPVLENGTVGDPVIFARNSAAVMVSVESSFVSSIGSVVDLLEKRNKGIVVGLCATSVPCGALADRVLANASLVTGDESVSRANIADTEASSAEDLVTKIQIGELDAGITYMSDCASARAGRVRCVDITADVNSTTDVVAVATSNSGIARDFVDFLVGDAARRILVDTHRFAEAP
jgi:molybdate transport system substrate-binding protein